MREHLQIQGGNGGDDLEEDLEFSAGQAQERPQALDDILDEINQVLSTDAQSLVRDFVQKGGQ